MGETAEELRLEIEQTRTGLGDTLDAIGDRVSPGRMVERSKNRMTGGLRGVVDKVMGKAQDTQHSMSGAGHDAAGTVRSHTQGAPLVVGALGFAAGFIVAAAFPPSEKEKAVSANIAEKVEPLKTEISSVGQELAENLKEPAKQAVDEIKGAAHDGTQAVTGAAQQSAADTKDQVHEAVDTVKEQAADDS